MAEKAIVPSIVADVIGKARENGYTNCGIVLMAQSASEDIDFSAVSKWMVEGDGRNDDRLLDALVNGYDVELEYKVGDWAVSNRTGKLCWITKIDRNELWGLWGDETHVLQFTNKKDARHATTEEIKVEKERRAWKSIGREVGEFRIGDAYELSSGNWQVVLSERATEFAYRYYKEGKVAGLLPTESFVSFEEVDSE